jgi:hypothetical protein
MALSLAGPSLAADLFVSGGYCAYVQDSALMRIDSNARLSDEVVRLMNESIAVSESLRWIYSRSQAFTWASEAKVACGKAYGYLRNDYRDAEYISKCDCFHSRMLRYMY